MGTRLLKTIRSAWSRLGRLAGSLGADAAEAAALREANRQLRNRLAALERSSRLNDILVKHVPADLFIHEEHGPFVCWNPWAERSTGYSAEELSRMRAHDFLDGVDLEMLGDYIARCFEHGKMSGRLRRLNKDGSVTPQDYVSAGVEVDGERYVVGVGVDVSDIAAAERSYQEIFNATSDAIFIQDPHDARILDVNQPMVEMFGFESREEVCRLTVGDLTSRGVPAAQEEALRLVRLAVEQGPQRFEWRGRKRNGAEFWIEVSLRSAEIGGQKRVLATVSDIDERKRAEQAIQESEERYRSLFETASDAIFLMRGERFVDCNPATLRIFGRGREEFIENTPYALSPYMQPDGRQSQEKAMEKIGAALAGEPQSFEWQHRRGDGEIFEAEVSLNRIRIRDAWYLLAIVRDISERKRAQERLAQYAERLEILHQIDRGILTSGSAEDIARAALGHVRRLLGCRRADIVLFDAAGDQAVVLATDADHETRFQPGLAVPISVFQHVLDAARRDEVSRLAIAPERSKRDRAFLAEGNRELVVTPMLYQGEVIGSLNLSFAELKTFAAEHEEIARQVAAQIAVAIQQARLREKVREHAEELERRVAQRTRELATLYDVSAVANEELDLETIMSRVLGRVMEAAQSDAGGIHLLEDDGALHLVVSHGPVETDPDLNEQLRIRRCGEGIVGQVLERCEPLLVADVREDERTVSVLPDDLTRYAGVPMRSRGRQVGVLSLMRKSTQPLFSDEEVRMLTTVADQVGVVAESVRLRQLARQAAVLEERNRLARDLHDSVTQSLYSLTLLAEAGRMAAENGDPGDAAQQMERLAQVGQQALKEMRLMIHELRPPGLEEEGLAGALQKRLDAVEGRAGVEARLLVQGEGRLPLQAEEELYRIALEALNNALKHARATTVTVQLRMADGTEMATAALEVADDGCGFEPDSVKPGGMGLTTMRERAEKLGGRLEIRSGGGTGTTVWVTLDQIEEQT